MDLAAVQQYLIDRFNALWIWVQEDVLSVGTAVQVAAVAIAFGLAFLIARLTRPWLEKQDRHPIAGRGIRILLPLWMPLIWALLQWLATTAATTLGMESARLLSSVTGLLFAWVAIRLASQVVRNPIFASIFVWTVWTIAAFNILDWLEPTRRILQDAVLVTLADATNTQPAQVISLYTIVVWTLSLVVLLSVAIYLSGFLESRIRTIRALSPSLQVLFIKSLKIVLITLATIIAINAVGIDLTALAVFGGALGVGIGFGLQRVVSNLIAGIILLVDKSIKPGDVIAVSGTYGWVTALGGRYVSVVTRDGVEHLIPNELLISERVENWTHTHSRTRLKVDVGVHYKTDVHQAIALCLEAAGETERVLADPEPKCLLIEFGDSSVNLQVRFWIADAHNGVQNVRSAVLLRIWDKFKEAGVEIPYPQRDLHLRSGFEALKP
ncbi:MAG TPA: mechanosensitive ion channel domain-containing protein [Gammaproteobacteria bacterium]|nr:mechanosensitive ion channel domain-containing protein [Gammaproteobacteria bacterium]